MAGIENNLTTHELIENLKHEVMMGKKNCQIQVITALRQLSETIVNAVDPQTDTPSVNKGFDDLALHVGSLETKLLVVTKERDDLLDQVASLRTVIGQMSAKLFATMQPVQLPLMQSQGNQQVDGFHNGNIETRGEEENVLNTNKYQYRSGRWETTTQTTTKIVQQQIRHSMHDSYNPDDSGINEEEYADTKPIEHMASDREESTTMVDMPRNDNMKKNLFYDATQKINLIDIPKAPATKKLEKKLKCDQCPKSFAHPYQVKAHVETVHAKIKKFRCEECGYASARKDGLETHWDAKHNKGDKKYKCGQCPYSNAQNERLKKHMISKHQG